VSGFWLDILQSDLVFGQIPDIWLDVRLFKVSGFWLDILPSNLGSGQIPDLTYPAYWITGASLFISLFAITFIK
jgi:hypothetical protein